MEIKTQYKFKKNESFYIRDGWFEKALNAIATSDKNVFSKNNGSQLLGIGANMAKGLKYWLQASGVIENSNVKTVLSKLGEAIKTYDPYFESDFTWFIIHYNLCINQVECPIFYSFFNSNFKKIRKSYLTDYLSEELSVGEEQVKREYLEDDLNVFLKSYVYDQTITNPEDNYVCPLTGLKLIKKTGDSIERQKPLFGKLPALAVYYALDRLYCHEPFNIEDSFSEPKSPYLIFNLDKNSYLQYLDELKNEGFITINRTAGLNTVYFETDEKEINDIFQCYFGGKK